MSHRTLRLAETPLGELVTGSAFHARPTDATMPLPARFAGKSLLVVAIARERAATLPVRFSEKGAMETGVSRQIPDRRGADFVRILRQEAQAVGAEWALVVLGTGWQAQISQRATRSAKPAAPFDRFRLPAEQPDLFVAQPRAENAHAVIDHPTLDRSVVFAFKRREIEEVLAELRVAGLGVAAVRLGLASQLELWFASARENALARDVLLSDGLSVLLLNSYEGDLLPPTRAAKQEETAPRQASTRPNDVLQDMARFVRDGGNRPHSVLGPVEFDSGADRPGDPRLHDATLAALAAEVMHDLNPDLREERSALPLGCRPWVRLGFAAILLLVALMGALLWKRGAHEIAAGRHGEQLRQAEARTMRALSAEHARTMERRDAVEIRAWLSAGYHAQKLAHRLVAAVPEGVALERMSAHLDESSPQMSLEFVLLGGEEAQVEAARALERAVLSLNYQIGERNLPVVAGKGRIHRWRLILPGDPLS